MWARLTKGMVLQPNEAVTVEQACRLADVLTVLQATIAADGPMVPGSAGQLRVHPAVAEVRATRLAMARIVGSVAWPTGDDDAKPMTARQRQGQRAVQARWDRVRARRDKLAGEGHGHP